MKTILMTAYDINPYKGSESATGWSFVLQIARFNKVVAVTRKNNRESIEQYIKEYDIDNSNMKFYYYDFPYYLRFWKRGARGSSLYFYLWQMFMPLFVISNKIKFDIGHNLNFHTDAFPTFLWVLRKPFIWGPINHHEKIPSQYILTKKQFVKDRIKTLIKTLNWNFDPFIHISKRTADFILVGNSSVIKRLNLKDNIFNLSQVASDDNFIKKDKFDKFTIISAGRLVQLKGFDITLASYENFYKQLSKNQKENIELLLIGSGPLKSYLINQSKNYSSIKSIKFIDWVTKEELNDFYAKSHLYLFPSYEGAGMVIAEALSFGLPIVCFDNYGPGELTNDKCAIKIPYSSYKKSVGDFSKALLKIYEDKKVLENMSLEAKKLFEEKYTWDSKGNEINELYEILKEKYILKDSHE